MSSPRTGGQLPTWEVGDEVATRLAYGGALTALGALRPDVVALDGEVSNSTHSELFAQAHPDRYFEMYIAEQQMIAAAVGLQARGWVPFASSFGAFLSRAYDFVRMAAVSRADLRLSGSHAGVSIGADGPSQMALEDMAALRAVHGSAVLHPSDANQTARLVAAMAERPGISYLRTLRGKTVVRTGPDEDVRIGGSRTVRSSDDDQVTLVACGVTVDEAERAAEALAADGVRARVIDCYSVKPIDAAAVRAAASRTGALVTVEDHWPEGGLGDAVLEALAAHRKVAVRTPSAVAAVLVRRSVSSLPVSWAPRRRSFHHGVGPGGPLGGGTRAAHRWPGHGGAVRELRPLLAPGAGVARTFAAIDHLPQTYSRAHRPGVGTARSRWQESARSNAASRRGLPSRAQRTSVVSASAQAAPAARPRARLATAATIAALAAQGRGATKMPVRVPFSPDLYAGAIQRR